MAPMFPPLEESILQSNPKFAALHKSLTTRILNPDGSSQHPDTADHDANAEALNTARIDASKQLILITSLASLPLTSTSTTSSAGTKSKQSPLPTELVELILILTLQLSSPVSPASKALLDSTHIYGNLHASIPKISALISTHLHDQALALSRVLNPTSNASFLRRNIANIPSTIATLQKDLQTKKAELAIARAKLVPLTTTILSNYLTAIQETILHLERNKHGQIARSVTAKSLLIATDAQVTEANASILLGTATGTVYTEEVKGALQVYWQHLRQERSRLRERRGEAEKELARYGVGREDDTKERTMKEVARVFGEMGRKVEEVRRDLERLEGH